MEFTIINPVDMYRSRVETLEREYLGHQMLQEEIRKNPEVTGDDEKKALAESQDAVKIIENAHAAACELLNQAEKDNPSE